MDFGSPAAEGDNAERLLEEARPDLERLFERHRVAPAAAAQMLVTAVVGVQSRLGLLPAARTRLLRAVEEACHSTTLAFSHRGGEGYGRAFAAACARLRRRRRIAAREWATAPGLLAELLRLPSEERRAVATRDRRFHTTAVVELILDRARREWTNGPVECEPLARLALTLLDYLPGQDGEARLTDLRALAWTHIANGRRILFDHRGAEAALGRSEALLARGSGDPRERALPLTVLASLRRAQRRFEDALRALEQVTAIHRWARDRHQEGQTMIARAIVYAYRGDPEQAIPLMHQALPLIDGERDPRLLFIAYNNLASYELEAGNVEEARRLLPTVLRHAADGDRLDRINVRWLEGQIELRVGDSDEGERKLLAVRDDSLAEGMIYNAALVSLELVAHYLEVGRSAEARRMAADMIPIFHSRDIHREALAALIALKRAADLDSATVGLVREVTTLLQRLRGGAPPPPEQPS